MTDLEPIEATGRSVRARHLAVRLRVRGAVQGVGFRPFVLRTAVELGLTGWVRNVGFGVEIVACGDEERLHRLEAALGESAPEAARVLEVVREPARVTGLTEFRIEHSSESAPRARISIPPDLATCEDCLREMRDPADRRHGYPFLNCTACGPRYSIALDLPYDRGATTMRGFELCPSCRAEYEDPTDRRFHAQPTACPDCGPQLAWADRGGREAARDAALDAAVEALAAGRVVAVQGLGGFHLCVRADDPDAVAALRERKRRGDKPFAVMFAHVAQLESAIAPGRLSDVEHEALTSAAAPIVLLRGRRPRGVAPEVAPLGLEAGCLLAYTPLHHLLLERLGAPVVATSANLSDEPIATAPDEARRRLGEIADGFLFHDRAIARPVDDSIVRDVDGALQVLRRGRGFAPLGFESDALPEDGVDLAVGAHQKCTVALRVGRRVTVSPHLGDLSTVLARDQHERAVEDLLGLVDEQPDLVVCDKHPDYASTQLAERASASPVRVQHHVAHVLATAFEHDVRGDYVALVWDGSGAGDDGTVWGGECFAGRGLELPQRVGSLATFPLLGGERAVREPWKLALGLVHDAFQSCSPDVLTRAPREFGRALNGPAPELLVAAGRSSVRTSSMGRVFDAVAAILGLSGSSDFEGDAPTRLEAAAAEHGEPATPYGLRMRRGGVWTVGHQGWLSELALDLELGQPVSLIAARFHATWVDFALRLAPERDLLLSGGCFQNRLLLEGILAGARATGRRVLFPRALPTNDGGIAVGQLVAAAAIAPTHLRARTESAPRRSVHSPHDPIS